MPRPAPPVPSPRMAPAPPPLPLPHVPAVGAPPARPKPPAWGLWAALVVLLGVGGGLYELYTSPSSLSREPVAVLSPASNPASPPAPSATPAAPTPGVAQLPAPSAAPAPGLTAVQSYVRAGDAHLARGEFDDAIAAYRRGLQLDPYNTGIREKVREAIKACNKENAILNKRLNCGASEPDVPVPDPKKAKMKFSMGDFHLRRGEYADAVAAYEEGLRLDPFNDVVPQKIALAIRECKEENKVMGESLDCGEHQPPARRPNPAPSTHQP